VRTWRFSTRVRLTDSSKWSSHSRTPTEHKPAATPQREALRRLSANAVVSVGDLPSDIASVRAAGLAAIGVSWGYGARSALIDAGAECVCDSAEELERELGARLRIT